MNKLILLLLVIILSACSSGTKKPATNIYYRFPENTNQPLDNLNIEVKRPSAMGILGNRPMVVQTENSGLIQMGNNFWLDSPKVLLKNYLDEVFESKSKEEVLTLNSRILALEKKQDEALLSIKFILTDTDNKIHFDKTYNAQKSFANNTISDFSRAIAALLDEMIKELIQDIQ